MTRSLRWSTHSFPTHLIYNLLLNQLPPFTSSSSDPSDSCKSLFLPLTAMGERRPSRPSSSPGETEGTHEEQIRPSSTSRSESCTSFFSRHKMTAAVTKLHNEIDIIQEELVELETIGGSAIVCEEFIPTVEPIPDPLLPETKGPADANWDRWFRGIHSSKGHRALDFIRKKRDRKFSP